jgi:hypothetical protein
MRLIWFRRDALPRVPLFPEGTAQGREVGRAEARPSEFNHELFWLSASVGTFIAGAIGWKLGLAWHCPFLEFTGYPCMTCGATRCAIALTHGNFPAAFWWNPLAFVALVGVALFDLYAIAVLLTRAPRIRVVDWTRTEKIVTRVAVLAVILINWAYLLMHRAQY